MAWNRKVAVFWTALFCINAVWTVSGAPIMDDDTAAKEWQKLIKWCQKEQSIIFNSTENCDFDIRNQELCSLEIVSLFNRKREWLQWFVGDALGKSEELIGDWKGTFLANSNPYYTCRGAGMVVEYGFESPEHKHALTPEHTEETTPAAEDYKIETHAGEVNHEANVAPASNFLFGCWMCLVVVLVVTVVLSAFFTLLVKQSPRLRVGNFLPQVARETDGIDSRFEDIGGSTNV